MRSKLWLIMTLLILASLFSGCAGSVEGPREFTNTEKEAVVMVKAQYKSGGLDRHSGFIISPDGYIFTFLLNWDELEKVEVVLFDGRSFQASVAAIDTLNDAARIKIEATNLNTLGLSQDVALDEGDEVVIAGYAEGRFTTTPAKVLEPNSTLPLPWAKLPAVKLNAGGEAGMMGGPVMDAAGHLVGAMLAIDPKTGESFMVPADGIISMFFPTPQKIPPPPSSSTESPVIEMHTKTTLAGVARHLTISADGSIVYFDDRGLRHPTEKNPPIRITKTGQLTEAELNSLLKMVDACPFDTEGDCDARTEIIDTDAVSVLLVYYQEKTRTITANYQPLFHLFHPEISELTDVPKPIRKLYRQLKSIIDNNTSQISEETISG